MLRALTLRLWIWVGLCAAFGCEREAGQTTDLPGAVDLQCPIGFSGPTCAILAAVCDPNPCQNGGSCTIGSGTFQCSCVGGFSGLTCTTPPAACATNPCQNGGECYDAAGSAACHCPIAFTGATCATPSVSGLASRPANSTCVAFDPPSTSGTLEWVPVGGGASDLDLTMRRQSTSGFWFETYRSGEVHVVNPQGTRSAAPLITVDTVDNGEMGLLGLALHPNFESSPYLYVYYNDFVSDPSSNVEVFIDRYYVDQATTTPSIDPLSRKNIFTFNRGHNATNHIGGSIEFDPLAPIPTLYFAIGDGGTSHSVCNPANPTSSENGACKAQYLASYHGKLLRFDVSDTSPSAAFTPEIVGLGLRNPFRWSFDSETGDLWIGDVGEGEFEEVSLLPRAQLPGSGQPAINFGWPCREGYASYASGTLCATLTNELLPVHAYPHTEGVSVIGGRVYRGKTISNAVGTYLFNDIFAPGNGPPWRLDPNPAEEPDDPQDDFLRTDIGDSSDPRGFVAYAEDADGELYANTMWGGIYKLQAVSGGPTVTVPATLSATGCFDASGNPRAGLIPFDVRAPLWSDGAQKRRWLAIPDGTSVSFDAEGDFQFPNGTVLVKEFTQAGVRIETRLFVKHDSGQWAGYTYAWADPSGNALTDAQLVGSAASVRDIPGTAEDWQFPSRGQCMSCHTQAAGYSLGLELQQLNGDLLYPSTGTTANQLHTLQAIGVLTGDLSALLTSQALPRYDDASSPLSARAHAYLHSNCASCHRPGASGFGGRSNLPDLRYRLTTSNDLAQLLCGREATAETLGLGDGAQLVEPGQPGTWSNLAAGGSVLYLRMAARDDVASSSGAMPPIGTRRIDATTGLDLLGDWITALSCP